MNLAALRVPPRIRPLSLTSRLPVAVWPKAAKSEPSFDGVTRFSFALQKAPTQLRDFYSPEEIACACCPDVERLLKAALGAQRVVIVDHTIRNAACADAREPVPRVHNDQTVNPAPQGVRDHRNAEAPELRPSSKQFARVVLIRIKVRYPICN